MKIKQRKSKLWNGMKILFPNIEMNTMWLTFGDTVWVPDFNLHNDLMAHESVHIKQQKNWFNAIFWWIAYLISAKFRYSQELPAHQAQLDWITKMYRDRNTRYQIKIKLAKAMAECYRMVDFNTALKDLQ